MQVIIHEDFAAPMAGDIDTMIDQIAWLPDDLPNILSERESVAVDGPNGRVSVWNAAAWTRSRESRFYFVSAVDGTRKHLVAGPYSTMTEAEDRVSAVRRIAEANDGRASFMMWGTASSVEPIETPLGDF